jgi:hypothetical protein
MNDGFLLAECVINYLTKSGFLENSEWKHTTKELYYPIRFYVKGRRASIVSFEIIVSGGIHTISRSSVRILEKQFSKDFSPVFSQCAVA